MQRGAGWIQSRADHNGAVTDSALRALAVGRRGAVLIGHLWSHFGTALYYAMAGYGGYAPPYVAVDGGGAHRRDSRESGRDVVEGMYHFAFAGTIPVR